MGTSLFILLKEYADDNTAQTSSYIKADNCFEEEAGIQYFRRLIEVIDYFRYEKCDRYFDSKNLFQATYPYGILKDYYEERDEYPGIAENILTQIGSMGFVDWRDTFAKDSEHYFLYDTDVTDDTLGEIAKNIRSGNGAVLLNMGAIEYPSPIEISYANNNCSVNVEYSEDIKGLHSWFSKNRRPPRIYNFHPKHGNYYKPAEMIPGTDRRAAQLKCKDNEAQDLLDKAIGYDTVSSLWYYDMQRNMHIYFENQNERRLAFHGYHLEEGDENFDNISIDKLKVILGEKYNSQ